ncbi:MAG TPA: hypothetical protein ENI13_01505 [candidate division CPR3 bacterium]|uniref:Uncharacterized protein n=1 Tax=candidate division CPR3 bacterium TaxID=2268181 RepID=A0A7C1SUT0_UNCC3|nr:hypothetical protein [candidate division CPR3 bacterium]
MKLPFLTPKKKPENRWLVLDIEDSMVKYGIGVEREGGSHITHCGTEDIKDNWESGLEAFLRSFQQIHISPSRAIVSLPSSVSKARIFKQRVLRGEGSRAISGADAEEIANNVIQIAGKKMAFEVAKETGIPPVEWMFLRLAIIGMSLDGYEVGELAGNNAQDMEFTVLGTLCLRSAFNSMENLCGKANITLDRVVDEIEAIDAFGQDGVYMNVGEMSARLLLVQGGSAKDMVEMKGSELAEQIESATLAWQQPSSVFAYGRDMSDSRHTPLFPEHILDMFPAEMIQQKQYTPLAFLCYAVS